MVGIYKITSPSGKVYIGQSTDIQRRKLAYAKSNKRRQECQPKLYNSIAKYGFENHLFEVIHELPEDASAEELTKYEQFYMDENRAKNIVLLNIREAGSKGKLHPDTIRKISISNTGKVGTKWSDEQRQNFLSKMKGRKYTPEQIEKYKNCRPDYKHSDATRAKMSKAWEQREAHSEESNTRRRIALLGKKRPPEVNAKVAAANKGRKFTDAHKLKLSEVRKGKSYPRDIGKKLTSILVLQIRSEHDNTDRRSSYKLAEKYNVSYWNINNIIKRKIWNHI